MNQRLSLEEVQEVARLAAQRRAVVHGAGPTVDRVSDALGLPPAQVESLLTEIRDRKAGLLPPEDGVIFKRLGLGAAALVALGVVVLLFNLFSGSGPKPTAAATLGPPGSNVGSTGVGRYDTPGAAAAIPSRQAVALPERRVDPTLSGGSLGAPRAEIKTYSTDLQNARVAVEAQAEARADGGVVSAR